MSFKLLYIACALFQNIYGWTLKPYNPVANSDAVIETNEARFTILTSNIIRMEYDPSGLFEDRASRIFVNRMTITPKFTFTNDSTITISTEYLNLTYRGGPFSSSSLSITGKVDDVSFNYIPSGDVNKDNAQSNNLFGTILGLDGIEGDFSLNCTENYGHGVDGYKHPHCYVMYTLCVVIHIADVHHTYT